MHLMVDFNQGLNLGEALQRCHLIDDLGLTWIEELIVYDDLDGFARLTATLKTPIQIARTSMARAISTRLCRKKRAISLCRTSCASAVSRVGSEPRPSLEPLACRCRRISTRRLQRR